MILGDWGTTSCRLWLWRDGAVRDTAVGLGVKFCDSPAGEFARLTRGWRSAHPGVPALLCGTVGANIGWVDAGYVDAPALLSDVARATVRVRGRVPGGQGGQGGQGGGVHILPGVRTRANAFGRADVMRSEEVQSWGWAALGGRDTARLCLPGSHTKWVELQGGAVVSLTTGFVGEMLATLRAHTILAPAPGEARTGEAFRGGVREAREHPSLVSALFGPRVGSALGSMTREAARDHLAGLLVGADCAGMLRAWGGPPDAVVGSGGAARGYRAALEVLGHHVEVVDGAEAVVAGLVKLARELEGTLEGTQEGTGGLGPA